MEPINITQLEKELNRLWKEQLPIIQFTNNYVEKHSDLIGADQNHNSIITHGVRNGLFVSKPIEILVFGSVKLSEYSPTLILEKSPDKICQKLKNRIKTHCNDVLKSAGYQHNHGSTINPDDILRAYGGVQGYIEMSKITAIEHSDPPRKRLGFIAIINVRFYVAKPRDVLQLAIARSSPQEVNP